MTDVSDQLFQVLHLAIVLLIGQANCEIKERRQEHKLVIETSLRTR